MRIAPHYFLLLLLLVPALPMTASSQPTTPLELPSTNTLTSHAPISIDGNADFHAQAAVEGWDLGGQRDGTKSAPYLIANLVIFNETVSNIIHINNTNVYFELASIEIDTNNSFSVAVGINLTLVDNAVIRDSHLYNINGVTVNIKMSYTTNVLVYNNSIFSGTNAIWFDNSQHFVVENNFVNDTNQGIVTTESKYGVIRDNHVNSVSSSGINIVRSTDQHIFNNVVNNSNNGIRLAGAADVVVEGNDVHDSTSRGIEVNDAFQNVIRWNNLYDNVVQFYVLMAGNELDFNYYNDYAGTDADGDMFFDTPYVTDGIGYEDFYPLSKPHNISRPVLTSSLTAFNSHETAQLSWDEVVDNFGNEATYNLYYKHVGQVVWQEIATGIAGTTYGWELNGLSGIHLIKLEAVSFGRINNTVSGTFTITATSVPSTVQLLEGEVVDDKNVLTWNAPADTGGFPILEYRIYRGTVTGTYTTVTSSNSTWYNDSMVDLTLTYYYKVSAVNAAGEGASSNEIVLHDSVAPTAELVGFEPNTITNVSGVKDLQVFASDSNNITHIVLILEGDNLEWKGVILESSEGIELFFELDTNRLVPGIYTMRLELMDSAGNQLSLVYLVRIGDDTSSDTRRTVNNSVLVVMGLTGLLVMRRRFGRGQF